jgi:DNA-binding CsgD family transcriptional regulator
MGLEFRNIVNTPILWLSLIIVLITGSCKQSEEVAPEFRTMDTIWHKIVDAKDIDSLGYKNILSSYWTAVMKSDKEVEWLINRMENSDKVLEDSDFTASLNLLKSWYHFSRGRDSLGLKYLNKINSNNIHLRLSKIQQQAQYYYGSNILDSALSYYNTGYIIAKEEENPFWLLNYANNIGTVYFDLRNFEMASEYFKEALSIAHSKRIKAPPMLLNNIVTCALVDSDGKEALQFYEQHKSEFQSVNPYEKAVFQVNRAHIYWKLQNLDSFKYYLDQVNLKGNIPIALGMMHDYHYGFYYAAVGDITGFNGIIQKYKQQILANPTGFLPQWTELMVFAKQKGINSLTVAEIRNLYGNLKPNDLLTLKLSLEILLSAFTSGAESAQWKIKALTTELQLKSQKALSFQQDLKQQVKIHSLVNENEQINLKLNLRNVENKFYLAFSIFAWVGILLLTIVFYMAQKNRRFQFQKLNLELENIRTINQSNYSKQQIADRVLSVNRATHKKLNYLVQKLRNSKFAKDPEIIEIRGELNSISELETDLVNEMSQIKTSDNILYLAEKFKSILSMNQTEQSVLGYIIEGHKVKEIAILMSISEQHVRNTKSKVFKMLSEDIGTTVSTQDLQVFRNKEAI